MKIEICINKVETVGAGWPGLSDVLVITGDGMTLRVPDTQTARKTYVIGRRVCISIRPGAQS